MRIGIFSKVDDDGGSEHRCAELCNAIVRHSEHSATLLCERTLNPRIAERLDHGVEVVRQVFKPVPAGYSKLYEVDRLVVVNSDSQVFTRRAYWEGRTEHHSAAIDLSRIRHVTFLFNFVISPSKHLQTLVAKDIDLRIICANTDYERQILVRQDLAAIQHVPRLILESPIDPEAVTTHKSPSKRIRIGKHSKAFGYKFNLEHVELIRRINSRFDNLVQWDFMGVPSEMSEVLHRFGNVSVRREYSMSVRKYLEGIDIFLFFIAWTRQEPWARAVAEAMLSGCPIVATDCPGNREQVEEGRTGYLCSSVDDLERVLAGMIERPADIRKMGTAAREAARRYESASVIARFLDFIR